jgi:cathepsin F
MMTYSRQYNSNAEKDFRFGVFKDNLKRIEYLNSNSQHATYGVNKFADLSKEEFSATYLMEPRSSDFLAQACLAKGAQLPEMEMVKFEDLPDSFDWRTTGQVSPVKDQGQCGSCWTFSTTGAMEGSYAVKNKVKATLLLSEQAIVDCSHNCSGVDGESVCNQGCDGGWPWAAATDVIRWGGLPTEDDYPYTAADGQCQIPGKLKMNAPPVSYTCLSGPDQKGGPADEKVTMANVLMQTGPLSIALDAGFLFQFYFGGIMNPFFPDYECDPTSLDHAVLLVGWGVEGSTPYWIVKNSWGESWGESGYLRMYRGEGLCGLNNAVMAINF